MQGVSEKNLISQRQDATSYSIDQTQQGAESGAGLENQSSQSVHEYISIDGEEVPNETNKVVNDEDAEKDGIVLKRKRQTTSSVWEDFEKVTLKDGTKKAQCIHCKTNMAISKSGTTTTYKRHLDSCFKRKQYMRAQQLLNLQPVTCNEDLEFNKRHSLIGPDAKYNANKMRESIAHWIMGTEQSFSVVDDELFVYMMKTATPLFERISRVTIKSDCSKVYEHEKKKLKVLTSAASKISLTTDCWKSQHQKIEYMVITGHFIDQNWRLHKHVLSFVHVPPPRTGRDIGDCIYKCIKEWEIEGKIFSISVDNAAYNEKVVDTLKDNFSRVRKLPCGGRLFHVRCCAHILNLVVKDGLSEINSVIGKIREAVKYINYSEARRLSFSNVAQQLQVSDRKLMLDVPTRWNSTFDMLSLAIKFKDVFSRYAEYEPHFTQLPSLQDWNNVERVCEILRVFKVVTNIISGSDYPTANLYLIEVYKVKESLDKGALSNDDFIRKMVNKMKEKFDKYWGECHLLMAIASVLDPRFKKVLIKMCYPILYTEEIADIYIVEVENALDTMYLEYSEMHDVLIREATIHECGSFKGSNVSKSNTQIESSGWETFGQFVQDRDMKKPEVSELKMYYEEGVHYVQGQGGMNSFDALEWWKIHRLKYPVLSQMAMDVLAIPISTVASEATFSAGGRVIDAYRSSMAPNTAQMLVCGGDWIRQSYGSKKKLKKEDAPTEILLSTAKTS